MTPHIQPTPGHAHGTPWGLMVLKFKSWEVPWDPRTPHRAMCPWGPMGPHGVHVGHTSFSECAWGAYRTHLFLRVHAFPRLPTGTGVHIRSLPMGCHSGSALPMCFPWEPTSWELHLHALPMESRGSPALPMIFLWAPSSATSAALPLLAPMLQGCRSLRKHVQLLAQAWVHA